MRKLKVNLFKVNYKYFVCVKPSDKCVMLIGMDDPEVMPSIVNMDSDAKILAYVRYLYSDNMKDRVPSNGIIVNEDTYSIEETIDTVDGYFKKEVSCKPYVHIHADYYHLLAEKRTVDTEKLYVKTEVDDDGNKKFYVIGKLSKTVYAIEDRMIDALYYICVNLSTYDIESLFDKFPKLKDNADILEELTLHSELKHQIEVALDGYLV